MTSTFLNSSEKQFPIFFKCNSFSWVLCRFDAYLTNNCVRNALRNFFLHLEIYFFVSCSFCRIFAISWTDLCESTLQIYWFITLEIVIWLSAFLECLWENAMQLFRIVLHNTNRKSGSQNILVLSASKNPQMKVKIKHTVLQSEITIAWSSCFDCHVESHIISKTFESVLIWITL